MYECRSLFDDQLKKLSERMEFEISINSLRKCIFPEKGWWASYVRSSEDVQDSDNPEALWPAGFADGISDKRQAFLSNAITKIIGEMEKIL